MTVDIWEERFEPNDTRAKTDIRSEWERDYA